MAESIGYGEVLLFWRHLNPLTAMHDRSIGSVSNTSSIQSSVRPFQLSTQHASDVTDRKTNKQTDLPQHRPPLHAMCRTVNILCPMCIAPHFTLVKEALIEIGCVVTSLVVGRWLVVTRVHCGQTVYPSYYGTLIGNPTPGIQWYNFRPPGVTPNRGMGFP